MLNQLLDPLFLFFVVGFIAGLAKSDVKLPESVYHLISTYLLLAIGLKGGVQLAQADPSKVWLPALTTIAVGVLTPFIVFSLARRLGKLNHADSASLGAHYGSVSAVTFAAAMEFARRAQAEPEGFMPVLLVLLEIPAIIIAIVLHRRATGGTSSGESYRAVIREILLNRSVFLLAAGLIVGLIAGPARFEPFELLFADAFRPILAFFILEMGLLASQRMSEIKSAGKFLFIFGIIWPLAAGLAGTHLGLLVGLSVGGSVVFGAMIASASYIAAPAAVRIAIPEANTAMSIAASLGITFPINLGLGIPFFYWSATAF